MLFSYFFVFVSVLLLGLTSSQNTTTTTPDPNVSTTLSSTTRPTSTAPEWQAYFTLVIVLSSLVLMAFDVIPCDMVMMGLVTILTACEIITVKQAVAGFGNTSLMSVVFLFPVAYALELTGGIEPIKAFFMTNKGRLTNRLILGHTIFKIMLPLGIISIFVHNTPLVAMFIPVISEICTKMGIPPSKMFLPFAFSIMMGGTCSNLGTSTNLVVTGLIEADKSANGFNMELFEVAKIGLPVFFAGMTYMMLFSDSLLPSRMGVVDTIRNPREYITTMVVTGKGEDGKGGELVGKTVAEANLRRLEDLFLVEIRRGGQVISAPGPEVTIAANDKLYFAGEMKSVIKLSKIRGLALDHEDESGLRIVGDFLEVVIASRSSLANRTVKSLNFRREFNAAILAIHRNGERLIQSAGDIVLEAGDTLILVASNAKDFISLYQHDSRFALVAPLATRQPLNKWKAAWTLFVNIAYIVVSAIEYDLVLCVLVALILLALGRCINAQQMRESVNLQVVLAMGSSFGLGEAMKSSGASSLVGGWIRSAAEPSGELGLFFLAFLSTVFLTSVVSNTAAVTVMYPILRKASGGADIRAIAVLLMIGASAEFLTPVGYQVNLMVYGPGGYKFFDYTKYGFPLLIVVTLVSVFGVYTYDYWWVWLLISILVMLLAVVYQQIFSTSFKPHGSYSETPDGLIPRSTNGGDSEFVELDNVVYNFQPDMGLEPIPRHVKHLDASGSLSSDNLLESSVGKNSRRLNLEPLREISNDSDA